MVPLGASSVKGRALFNVSDALQFFRCREAAVWCALAPYSKGLRHEFCVAQMQRLQSREAAHARAFQLETRQPCQWTVCCLSTLSGETLPR